MLAVGAKHTYAAPQINYLANNLFNSYVMPMQATNQQLYRPAVVAVVLARNAEGYITKSLTSFAIRTLPPYLSHWSTTEQLRNAQGDVIAGQMRAPLAQSGISGHIYGVGNSYKFIYADPDDATSAWTGTSLNKTVVLRLENDGALGVQLNAEPEIIHTDYVNGVYVQPDNQRIENTPLVIDTSNGADDLYYVAHGSSGNGRLMRFRQAALAGWESGVPEIVVDFPAPPHDIPESQEALITGRILPSPHSMLLASDGNIYGTIGYLRGIAGDDATPRTNDTQTGILWRLDPRTDQFHVLYHFTLEEGELYHNSGHLVEKDGYLYGSLGSNCLTLTHSYRSAWPASGLLENGYGATYSPLCSGENGAYVLGDSDAPRYVLPYPHADSPHPYGSLFRITLDGNNFQILHRFNDNDGAHPSGPLALGRDGHIYGTTMTGGLYRSLNIQWTASDVLQGNVPLGSDFYRGYLSFNASSDGTLFRLKTDEIIPGVLGSGFEHLHSFQGGVGDNQQGNDGTAPVGLLAGSDGKLYGMTSQGGRRDENAEADDPYLNTIYGTVFQVDPDNTAPSARIALTAEPATVKLGESSLLQWTASNASDCTASGGETGDGWAGAKAASGSQTITPSSAGQISYNLTCHNDLVEPTNGTRPTLSNFVRLYVDVNAVDYDGNVVDYDSKGAGSLPALLLLALAGALLPARRKRQPA